jgi:hypothetical protein
VNPREITNGTLEFVFPRAAFPAFTQVRRNFLHLVSRELAIKLL